jgi:MSHA biogenesis protein MshO
MKLELMGKRGGFTLIELVITMVLLGILALATTDFIRTGSLIYRDGAERQVLLGEARFAIQRLSRELQNSLPNSARVDGIARLGECLTFVPTLSSHSYVDLPLTPRSAASAAIVSWSGQPEVPGSANVWAAVYVLNSDEVVSANGLINEGANKVAAVNSLSADASSGLSTLNFDSAVSFRSASPAQRLYLISEAVRYCVAGSELRRYQPASSLQGVLMANRLDPRAVLPPFQVLDASLSRNGLVKLAFSFTENNEVVEFQHDIVVPNQP